MKGIKRIAFLSISLSTGISAFSLFSDTLFLGQLKKATELKIEETVVPLPRKIKDLILKVGNEMKLKEKQISSIKPYLTRKLDLTHYGYSPGLAGAILGIPQYFLFDEKAQVQLTSLVDSIELPPEAPETEILKNSLFLSEAAKKFGIARQINESKHHYYYPLILIPAIFGFSLYSLFFFLVRNPNKLKGRISILQPYFIIMSFGFCLIMHDIMSVYREAEADFQAAELGKAYVEGGIEYYEKMIQRNKLLKKLNKDFPYTEDGDININWLRTNHMALSRRVIYLKDLMKATEKKEEKPCIWDYVMLKEILQK